MNMFRWLSFAAAMMAVSAFADIKINANLKSGDVLSGKYVVTVTCESASTITQVEFYLNDSLLSTDSSTPYEAPLDTLLEKEGPQKLEIAAYAEDGTSQKQTVNFAIDNKIGLGAAHHTEIGEGDLREKKYDDAVIAARTALKADPKYVPALIVLGRALMGNRVFDEAEKYLQDAIDIDQNNIFAYGILSQVHVQKAITVRAIGANDAANTEKNSYMAAADAFRKSLELQIAALGPITAENRSNAIDLHIQLGNYSKARELIKAITVTDIKNVQMHNRLMFVLIRRGELTEAQRIFDTLQKKKIGDGDTMALGAVLASMTGNNDLADNRIQEAIKQDRSSLTVKLSQAYVLLDRGKVKDVRNIVQDLEQGGFTQPEVYYYLGRMHYALGDFDLSDRNYQDAISQNPLMSDVFVSRGMESLAAAIKATDASKTRHLPVAQNYFDVALKARPETAGALVGNALVLAYLGKKAEAARYADGAMTVGGEMAWVSYVCAGVYSHAGQADKAMAALNAAMKQSPNTVPFGMPKLDEAFKYLSRWGRAPVLIRP